MQIDKVKEIVWTDIVNMARANKVIPTTRGEASAEFHKIEGENIYLLFYRNGEQRTARIRKKDFDQAIDVLEERQKVRQSDISNSDKRYVLGAMGKLPYFEISKEFVPKKVRPVPFIVWKNGEKMKFEDL